MKRSAQMIHTWREDGSWDELTFKKCTRILNMCFIFMNRKVEAGKKKVLIEWVGWNFIVIQRKYVCISWGNIMVNSIYRNYLIHIITTGLPGWRFDRLTRSGGDGVLVTFNRLNTSKNIFGKFFIFMIWRDFITYILFIIFFLVFMF